MRDAILVRMKHRFLIDLSIYVPFFFIVSVFNAVPAEAQDDISSLPIVDNIESQPLLLQMKRLQEALDYIGAPLTKDTRVLLEAAEKENDSRKAVEQVQKALDEHCLLFVHINPESRVKVHRGLVQPTLVEKGWRSFLVKVHNEAGVTAALQVDSEQNQPLHGAEPKEVNDRWVALSMFDGLPLQPQLSGLELEYRILEVYSRDHGKREARIAFHVGQGTQDIGFRNHQDILFDALPSSKLTFRVFDYDDTPTIARFVIKDTQGRVYPYSTKRLAPAMMFHEQIYMADKESLILPHGQYNITFTRGPEYISETKNVLLEKEGSTVTFSLKRWVHPAKYGWWSGDHHIHAAGCKHYRSPTQGILPEDMMRFCVGEGLNVGCVLTWGPCFDYQKQFFTGQVDAVSQKDHIIRYDIEVSGFGSHKSGHLCLLRLQDQMYPGGTSKHHWPTLGLHTLRWAKAQGAVCGTAHSGFGLAVTDDTLPSYQVPRYDGIGANEFIVDVTHKVPGKDQELVPAIDFLAMGDTPYVWELNMWYHILNCGYRTRISGETDFPCIYGDRVGMSRSYVRLTEELDYDKWCAGIETGQCYVSDGLSHILDFKVDNVELGENQSVVELGDPTHVIVHARVAALLDKEMPESFKEKKARLIKRRERAKRLKKMGKELRNLYMKPYWHLEWARIHSSRKVPIEVIVNGKVVAKKEIQADGEMRDVQFTIPIEKSSWIALRILPSSHTNPFFIIVGGKEIRADKASAEWCLKGVDQCWSQKERFISKSEHADAVKAYDHARREYQRILSECN